MMNGHKNVRQYSDQMHCAECGKQWLVVTLWSRCVKCFAKNLYPQLSE